MSDATESPRELIKAYAEALRALSQESTEKEEDYAIIDIREINQEMESRSAEVSAALHELLEQGSQCCHNRQT